MSPDLDQVILVPKAIDNSKVVREVDPRASRDLWWLFAVVATLVFGLVLYAWPHLQVREVDVARVRMSREREQLLEENRKLKLEKASLQNLRRVEQIAIRDLGLRTPPPESLVVVEQPPPARGGGLIAGGPELAPSGGPAPAPKPAVN